MGYNSSTNQYSRDLRFTTDEDSETGDKMTQAQFDEAIDENTAAVNKALFRGRAFDNYAALIAATSASYSNFSEGELLLVGHQVYEVMASSETSPHETTTAGLKLNEAAPFFSTSARAAEGVTNGAAIIFIAGEAYNYDASGGFTTRDGRKWTKAKADIQIYPQGPIAYASLANPLVLDVTPDSKSEVAVYIDGVRQHDSEWSLSGANLTMTGGWPAGMVEAMIYIQRSSNYVSNDFSHNSFTSRDNLVTYLASSPQHSNGDVFFADNQLYIWLMGSTAIPDMANVTPGFVWQANVMQFGADDTGVADSTTAFNAAATWLLSKGGGEVKIPTGDFLIDGMIFHSQKVGFVGDHTEETRLIKKSTSSGHVFVLLEDFDVTITKESPQPRFKGFTIDGQAQGVVATTATSTTATSNSFTVADATGIETGMLVDMEGLASGTTVSSVVSTTVTVSNNVSHTMSNIKVKFRPTVAVSTTTVSTDDTVVVASAAGLTLGMMATGTGIANNSFITEIDGTDITLSRPATASATNTITFYRYDCGFATYHDEDGGSTEARGPVIEDVTVFDMSGDAFHFYGQRQQIRMTRSYAQFCHGLGMDVNSCADVQLFNCGWGNNFMGNLKITTCSTARLYSCEIWQHDNRAYYGFRSQTNTYLSWFGGDADESSMLIHGDGSTRGRVIISGVNFSSPAKRNTDGVLDAYITNDDFIGLEVTDCAFKTDGTLGAPTNIVNHIGSGSQETMIDSHLVSGVGYTDEYVDDFSKVLFAKPVTGTFDVTISDGSNNTDTGVNGRWKIHWDEVTLNITAASNLDFTGFTMGNDFQVNLPIDGNGNTIAASSDDSYLGQCALQQMNSVQVSGALIYPRINPGGSAIFFEQCDYTSTRSNQTCTNFSASAGVSTADITTLNIKYKRA